MNEEVIKSFLVGLGFSVDESSLSKFSKSIVGATAKVAGLYAVVTTAAGVIAAGISSISKDFEDLGYEYKLIAPALNKAIILRQEMFKAYSAAGVNLVQTVQAATRLNLSVEKTKLVFTALYRSVASKFFPLLTKQSDLFRKKIYDNMPKIRKVLEGFVTVLFKALEIMTTLGERVWQILEKVWDLFKRLNDATDGWLGVILAVGAGLALILSPFTAILALFDDFEVWKEGGKSLFDWSPFVPIINSVEAAIGAVGGELKSLTKLWGDLITAFYNLVTGNPAGFWKSMGDAVQDAIGYFNSLLDVVTKIGDVLQSIGGFIGKITGLTPQINKIVDKISDFGADAINALQGVGGGGGLESFSNPATTPPLGAGPSNNNSQTNQNVTQQTNINVQGVADANAVGKSVSSEQTKVNFDLVRNLKGAVV